MADHERYSPDRVRLSVAHPSAPTRRGALVCFCGTGGTGKTSAMRAFLEAYNTNPDDPRWLVKPSIVREYYSLRGVRDEAEYLSPGWGGDADRFEFQIGLLDYYMQTTAKFLDDNPDDHVVMDRSAFDHVAYCLISNMTGSIEDIRRALSYADRFAALRPALFFFPYPAPWTGAGVTEDGFRKTDAGKDYVVSALMRAVLQDHYRHHYAMIGGSPQERAAFVMRTLSTGGWL